MGLLYLYLYQTYKQGVAWLRAWISKLEGFRREGGRTEAVPSLWRRRILNILY
jgi:hypothetical protein